MEVKHTTVILVPVGEIIVQDRIEKRIHISREGKKR